MLKVQILPEVKMESVAAAATFSSFFLRQQHTLGWLVGTSTQYVSDEQSFLRSHLLVTSWLKTFVSHTSTYTAAAADSELHS